MKEEKNDNKFFIIVVIISLIICLIGILYFMSKIIYIGNKNKEEINLKESDLGDFTELTKYELQEGEKINIGDKNINLKKNDDKIYLNDKILEKAKKIYVTNKDIIITSDEGQQENDITTSETYRIYNLMGEQLQLVIGINIRLENNKIIYDDPDFTKTEQRKIGDIYIGLCENNNLKQAKKLKEYEEELNEHKNDAIININEIIYNENKINIKIYKSKLTINDMINNEIYCGSLEESN